MKITRRSTYLIARGKGLVTATEPDEPGERYWFANQQHKLISPQKGLTPEKAIEWLINR
jgi:hypothetical protein